MTTTKKTSPKEMVKFIHDHGMKAGVAIKPGTDVEVLYEIFDNRNLEEVPEVSFCNLHSLITAKV